MNILKWFRKDLKDDVKECNNEFVNAGFSGEYELCIREFRIPDTDDISLSYENCYVLLIKINGVIEFYYDSVKYIVEVKDYDKYICDSKYDTLESAYLHFSKIDSGIFIEGLIEALSGLVNKKINTINEEKAKELFAKNVKSEIKLNFQIEVE